MNRENLLKALKSAIPGIDKEGSLIVGAENFVFSDGMVQSYNDRLSITYPIDIDGIGKEPFAVRAADFYRVLDKMTDQEVSIKVDGSELILTGSSTELKLKMAAADDLHNLIKSLDVNSLKWESVPQDFTKALGLCLSSVGTDFILGALAGVRVNGNEMMSSDNWRASLYIMDDEMPPFTLPFEAARELAKLDLINFTLPGRSWIHFKDGNGAVFSSRLISSEFPEEGVKRNFNKEIGKLHKMPIAADGAIERAAILSYEQDHLTYITIEFKNKDITILGGKEFATITEKIKSEEKIPTSSININPAFLKTMLSLTREFSVNEGKCLIFRSEKFSHLVALIVNK